MLNLIRYPARLQVSHQHGKALRTLGKGAYCHLGVDAVGSMHIYVNIHIGSSFTRVTVAKGYLLDAIMHSLSCRPIRMPQQPYSWYAKELQNLRTYPIENLSDDQIESWYTQAQAALLEVCGKNITPEQRTACTNQIAKLTARQEAISKSILAIDSIACARSVEASL